MCWSYRAPRMHSHIASFPSKVMYHSRLKSHSSVEAHLLRDLPNTEADSEDDEKEILGTPIVFYDTAGCEYFERLEGDGDEGSRCNENEASVVKMWVDQLVRLPIGYPVTVVINHRESGWWTGAPVPDRSHHTVCIYLFLQCSSNKLI